MRRNRNAKIVATLGPASSDKAMVRRLFLAGVDVFRLNFSHGTPDDHRARFAVLRELEAETGRPIGILADLQGPKLRVGTFADFEVLAGRCGLAVSDAFGLQAGRVVRRWPNLRASMAVFRFEQRAERADRLARPMPPAAAD